MLQSAFFNSTPTDVNVLTNVVTTTTVGYVGGNLRVAAQITNLAGTADGAGIVANAIPVGTEGRSFYLLKTP